MLYVMTPETVYQRFCKKRIMTVTRLEYDNDKYRPIPDESLTAARQSSMRDE